MLSRRVKDAASAFSHMLSYWSEMHLLLFSDFYLFAGPFSACGRKKNKTTVYAIYYLQSMCSAFLPYVFFYACSHFPCFAFSFSQSSVINTYLLASLVVGFPLYFA